MVMDTFQIRMNKELVKRIDTMVKGGLYSNRADVIRDAVRRFILAREVGSIKNTGNSVKEIRKIRDKLSKEIKSYEDIEAINNFRG
jgi:Arc/MetJ-type ribon-helix-helix transcriptional regulator